MAAGGEKSLFFECVAAGKWAMCLRMPHTHVHGAPLIGLGELLKKGKRGWRDGQAVKSTRAELQGLAQTASHDNVVYMYGII